MDLELLFSTKLSLLAASDREVQGGLPPTYHEINAYENGIFIGTTMGADSLNTGSIGTALELTDERGKVIHCAPTNFHNMMKNEKVKNAILRGKSLRRVRQMVQNGLVPVQSPSIRDHGRLVDRTSKDVDIVNAALARYKYGTGDAEQATNVANSMEDKMDMLNKHPDYTFFGTVGS